MEGLLEGKVAIITGAGSGVGRAACSIFARHGAKVVGADVNAEAIEETIQQVKSDGGTAIARICDVGDADAVNALVAAAVEVFGRLDIMYNNAGISQPPKPGQGMRVLPRQVPKGALPFGAYFGLVSRAPERHTIRGPVSE